jgi:ATP-dependent DNA ligase
VRLRSRNDKDFNRKYPGIAKALGALPDETVIDGEVVALDETGRPSFNALQNGAAHASILYYIFDLMVLRGRNVMGEMLATRRDLLTREVLLLLGDSWRKFAGSAGGSLCSLRLSARLFFWAIADTFVSSHCVPPY